MSMSDTDKVAEAYDNLGGMWSWNDAYLDNQATQHLWITRAGRLLREVVGRPAQQPKKVPPLAEMEDSPCQSSCCHACEVCFRMGCRYEEWLAARSGR